MSKSLNAASIIVSRVFRHSLIALIVPILCIAAAAQTSTTTSATDGSTPSALTPGSPEGSYALSGFDNINPFNGNLNFRLPLLHISGRGDAQYTMTLPIDTNRWRVEHTTVPSNCGPNGCQTINHFYHADYAWWNPSSPGYGPGVLRARRTGDSPLTLSGCTFNSRTMTRLTFTAPDGTEFELIDQANGGKPLTATSCFSSPSRGTVFVTADATSASFVSDSVIVDTAVPGVDLPLVSGFLMLRSGVRYRIDSSQVTWIRDRNGNMLTFSYTGGLVTTITDALGRVVTINYNQTDANGVYDSIGFKGFVGAPRTIQVRFNSLGGSFPDGTTVLRPGYSLQSPLQLFPRVVNSSNSQHNPTLATAVVLPDGRQYRFRYNPYAELWRVELPTGGAFEYEDGPGFGTDAQGVVGGANQQGGGELGIYRRVTERRVYPDGVTLEGKMVYTEASHSVTLDHQDPSGNSLAKDEQFFLGPAPISRLTDPQTFTATQHEPWNTGKESMAKEYDKLNGPQLRQVDNTWFQSPPSWWTDLAHPDLAPPNNPVLTDVVSTLKDVTPNLVSKQHYGYDSQFFNQILVEEYDFGSNGLPGSKLRYTETVYVTGGNYTNPGADPTKNPNLRSLPSSVTLKDGNGVQQAQTTFEYDNYTVDPLDPFHSSLTGRSGISGLDSGYLDPNTGTMRRGNVTKISKWLNTPSGTIDTYGQYDVAGNVVELIDPRSTINNIIATTVDFSDHYGVPNGDARQNTAPIELGTQMSYAFPTKVTNAAGHIAYAQFDYYIGRPVDGEDTNLVVASGYYQDLLDRPTKIIRASDPASSSVTNQTTFTYTSSAVGGSITTNSDKDAPTDGVLTSTVLYDGLGRTTETRTSAPEGTIYTMQKYDALGRGSQTSNPFRTGDTILWTTTDYDGLSRVKTVTTPDLAVMTTTYLGNQTTVADQATKQRRSIADGLGRLSRVDEPDSTGSLGTVGSPTQPTSYLYDVLDDLTTVTQGSQTRSFTYDSLKRLTQAFNPESGTINYTYDANSNLLTRQDARLIATNYFYDAVNRITKRTCSDSTPEVDYYYDNQALPQTKPPNFTPSNSIGRLTAACYGGVTSSAGNYQSYDRLGRVTSSYQQTDLNNYGFTYGYNLSGAMTSETYPSGRVVQTEYDSAGRIAGVKKDATTYYAGAAATDATNRIQYAPQGAVSVMKLGNGKWEHTNFNSRLQPTQIGLGTSGTDSSILRLDYEYTSSCQASNNGNILKQTITAPGLSLIQNYCYDALNRLSSASENSGANWSQSYGFDRWGNRWVSASTGYILSTLTPTNSGAFNTANNRLFASGYDNAGNQTGDAQSRSFTYNAENRQLTFNGTSGQYFYDGDGHRVKKIDSSGTTVFVYNAGGELIAEYHSDPAPPPAGGGGTSYLTSDHLGSTRVVTKSDGTVKARYDYLPFGEELGAGIGQRTTGMGYSAVDSTRQKFTQKERDNESGLDYFLARYHSSAQGRFTSTDPYNIVMETQTATDKKDAQKQFKTYLSNPQRWNRYPYALNNPLFYTDPKGEDVTIYYIPDTSGSGHIFIYVRNDESGESAYLDYVPDSKLSITTLWGDNNTMVLAEGDPQRIRSAASLTIETTKEQEQAILNGIKSFLENPKDWNLYSSNCITQSQAELHLGGIDIGGVTPKQFWNDAVQKYGESKPGTDPPKWPGFPNSRTYNPGGGKLDAPAVPGHEYNRDPRGQARKLDSKALPERNIYIDRKKH